MFETRISKSWGVSEGILAGFFLENLHEDIEGGLTLFVARAKQTGRKLWLKVSNGSDPANAALASEVAVWDGLQHPHLLVPCESKLDEASCFIAYPWQAEVAILESDRATMSLADLIRICTGLVDAVGYLQSLEKPIAHNGIGLSSLCLRTSLGWPILTGFHLAKAGASPKELQGDRKCCWDTVNRVCFGKERSGEFPGSLSEAGREWVKLGNEKATGLTIELKREFVRRVIADL